MKAICVRIFIDIQMVLFYIDTVEKQNLIKHGDTIMEKESIELHTLWHIDAMIQPYPVTIVTTMDEQGNINAGAYSLVLPFCSTSRKHPQMLLISNAAWHTAKNIEATGEFVLNYPRADQLNDINETGRFYPAGENELDHTKYTTIPSNVVCPPRIAECYQHLECRLHEILRPSQHQCNIIGEVVDLSLDAGLYAMPRNERIQKVNVPIYYGVDAEHRHIYGMIEDIRAVPFDPKVD